MAMPTLPQTPGGVADSPAVLSAQEIAVPGATLESAQRPAALRRLRALFPAGQFLRYLCVGVWNTVFGFGMYALFVSLLAHLLPTRWLALNALLASVLSTPINITMAFLGYKFVVFRTRGNYFAEWLRCFAVYGTSMIPSLLVLSGLTRLFQTLLRTHHAKLAAGFFGMLSPLPLSPAHLAQVHRFAQSSNVPAYLAGGLLMAFTTVFSFIGHKTFSFKPGKSTPPAETPKLIESPPKPA